MVKTMEVHDSGPIAVRYPRGEGRGVPLPETPQQLEIGKGCIIREGKVAILSLGTRLAEAEKAAAELEAKAPRPPPSPTCALRQAARQRDDPPADDHARGGRHRRGRRRSAGSARMC